MPRYLEINTRLNTTVWINLDHITAVIREGGHLRQNPGGDGPVFPIQILTLPSVVYSAEVTQAAFDRIIGATT